MGYSTVTDVGLVSGVSSTAMISDADITSLITFSDQQIDDDIGTFPPTYPTRIVNLSALLTAIKIYNRPDFRAGFRIGDTEVSQEQVEKAIDRWTREVNHIYAYYGRSIMEAPVSLKMVKD